MITIDEVHDRETPFGTRYRIEKWTCPHCGKPKSTLYIDGVHCHGDGMSFGFHHNGEPWDGCTECSLARVFPPPAATTTTSGGVCDICHEEHERHDLSHIPIYVNGSEGVMVCIYCQQTITDYLRGLRSAAARANKQGRLAGRTRIAT